MALVQQAGGQQREVGHGIGLHGAEGRVCHDGAQCLLVQLPAQELAHTLHGAMEILGAGEKGQGARRREGTPGKTGAPDPEFGCLSPTPDLCAADLPSLPQFLHLQQGWVRGHSRGQRSVMRLRQNHLLQVRNRHQPVCTPNLLLPRVSIPEQPHLSRCHRARFPALLPLPPPPPVTLLPVVSPDPVPLLCLPHPFLCVLIAPALLRPHSLPVNLVSDPSPAFSLASMPLAFHT